MLGLIRKRCVKRKLVFSLEPASQNLRKPGFTRKLVPVDLALQGVCVVFEIYVD